MFSFSNGGADGRSMARADGARKKGGKKKAWTCPACLNSGNDCMHCEQWKVDCRDGNTDRTPCGNMFIKNIAKKYPAYVKGEGRLFYLDWKAEELERVKAKPARKKRKTISTTSFAQSDNSALRTVCRRGGIAVAPVY